MVNKGEEGIIGIPYLSTRVDRSRGKYRRARNYGYSILVHQSTCQPVYQG